MGLIKTLHIGFCLLNYQSYLINRRFLFCVDNKMRCSYILASDFDIKFIKENSNFLNCEILQDKTKLI